MKTSKIRRGIVVLSVLLALPFLPLQSQSIAAQQSPPPGVDAAFERFWAADSPAEAATIAEQIEKSGITFEEAHRRLAQGRVYVAQPTGAIQLRNQTSDGIEHIYSLNIPADYDPARKYQVRFQLHGGIGGRTDNQPRGNGEIGALAGAQQIYVLPNAWNDEPWWSDDQVLNINAILDSLKRSYNIDENRVVLSGVSDGGTGTYFLAMRYTTPFASFLPLNGFIMVLAYREFDDGHVFVNNLRNKPMFVVNGGRDPLYPTSLVEPFTRHLMSAGVDIDYQPQVHGEHNTKWWPDVEPLYEQFVASHPRNPNPDHLTWEAAEGSNDRAHWLVIDGFRTDKSGTAKREGKNLHDANILLPSEQTAEFNNIDGLMFNRVKDYGRVDLVRTGNTVQATTEGVTAFTLLLSPDAFDLDKPVKIVANGRTVFSGHVDRSLHTLLKWAAQDNDRTMLYAAELHIRLDR